MALLPDPYRDRNRQISVAGQAQRQSAAAKHLAALQAARDDLIKNGALPGSLPPIHSAMSADDMQRANIRMSGIAAARANAAPPPPPQVVAGNDPASAAFREAARADGAMKQVGPGAPAAVAAPGERTPLETALATVPNHQGVTVDARQTGAGMVTTFPGSGGPNGFGARDIAVNPTFEQIMHAKTGGQWQNMTAPQRAAWLRANPAQPPLNADNAGVVTDTGRTAPDAKGVSTLQTPNGVVNEYDPRNDKVNSVNGVTGPAAVDRSIEQRYGRGVPGTITQPAAPNPLAPPAPAVPAIPVVSPGVANLRLPTRLETNDAPGSMRPALVPPFPQVGGDPNKIPGFLAAAAPKSDDSQPNAWNPDVKQPGATNGVSDNPKPAVPSAVDNKDDLGDFLQNEHDDQFKKGLVFQGFNDGVAV